MADEIKSEPVYEGPPEKKNNKTLWIVLAIVALVIIICCVLAVVGSFVYLPAWYNRFGF
jgi:hypothetical protein